MTNDDITKYNGMIYKIINRYKSRYHDKDDLYQLGAIGVIYAYESYRENKKTEFDTWVYKCIQWQVLRALRLDTKNKDIKEVSIYLDSIEGEDIQLIDMLEDETVNIYNTVENKCMNQFFINEFKRLLEGHELECILYIYNNCRFIHKEISKYLCISESDVRNTLQRAYRKLRTSGYLYNWYLEMTGQNCLEKAGELNKDVLDIVIARERLDKMYRNLPKG